MAIDPSINIQPKTQNPHDVSLEEGKVELSSEILQQAEGNATSQFENSPEENLIEAAYVSKKLEEFYEETDVYFMAEVGPTGVKPVARGDSERFIVDEVYDPQKIEGDISPLKSIQDTGYDSELGSIVAAYQVEDLESQPRNLDSIIEELWWGRSLEKLSAPYLVAPGMQDIYREELDSV